MTKVRVREGLACDIKEGPWKLIADLGEPFGGTNTAPNPGVFGRAALGSCLAMSYIMWATKLNIQIASLEVEARIAEEATRKY